MSALFDVTEFPENWRYGDPVRQDLGVEFKSAKGRKVFGLKGDDDKWKAFLCCAFTRKVPKDIGELEFFTETPGKIAVPYTVWSLERGYGSKIVREVVDYVKKHKLAQRVVTLSPLTEMARKFHLKNKATELQINDCSVNFEYAL